MCPDIVPPETDPTPEGKTTPTDFLCLRFFVEELLRRFVVDLDPRSSAPAFFKAPFQVPPRLYISFARFVIRFNNDIKKFLSFASTGSATFFPGY